MSVRLAPGVRVRVSSRGVRTSLGPRVARVHVGGGRPGVSTGVGPFGFYSSLGSSSSRRSSPGSASRSIGGTAAAQAKAERAQAILELEAAITSLHRAQFSPARVPMAVALTPIDEWEVRARHGQAAKRGLSWFDFAGKRQAAAAAVKAADREIFQLRRAALDAQADEQRRVEELWRRLQANDPPTVFQRVEEAFEDNEAPAAPLGLDGSRLDVAVLAPSDDVLPEESVGQTNAGNLSVRRSTKSHRAQLYKSLVAGALIASAREALAVAPGLSTVRVCAVRPMSAAPEATLEALALAEFERERLKAVDLSDDAESILHRTATGLLWSTKGAAAALQGLPVNAAPGLDELLAQLNEAPEGSLAID